MNWNRSSDFGFRALGINRFVNDLRRRFRECDRNISLHEQVYRLELVIRIVRINQELLETPQLPFEIIETESDLGMVLIRNQQAIAFGKIDLADLKTRLHEASRAQAQKLKRGFCVIRFDRFSRFERLTGAARDQG